MKKQVRKSVLIFTEGLADKNFTNSLKNKLRTPEVLKYTVRKGNGGSPDKVVKDAIKQKDNLGYDYCCVLIDEDLPISAACRSNAKANGIFIIVSKPVCIEGMLLKFLGVNSIPQSAKGCKSAFAREYREPYKFQTPEYFDNITAEIVESDNIPDPVKEILNVLNGTHKMFK